jgi:hypothetical protein
MSRLVAIWNKLRGVKPVTRFRDRKTAARRIWEALQGVRRLVARAAKKDRAIPPRRLTKAAAVIAQMGAPAGVSLKAIMTMTGWQAHTVRGFVSGHLTKRLGLGVRSFKRDGERIYQILGHTRGERIDLLKRRD